eukprot:GHVU01156080.1.p1 GENE.GHVU01156080.1~~GHVU01156080.1.p1  ORF type:complete len:193 (-),score=19.18 GHVU01156080.1:115-693(-)
MTLTFKPCRACRACRRLPTVRLLSVLLFVLASVSYSADAPKLRHAQGGSHRLNDGGIGKATGGGAVHRKQGEERGGVANSEDGTTTGAAAAPPRGSPASLLQVQEKEREQIIGQVLSMAGSILGDELLGPYSDPTGPMAGVSPQNQPAAGPQGQKNPMAYGHNPNASVLPRCGSNIRLVPALLTVLHAAIHY